MWWVIHHSICSTKSSSSCWSLEYLFIVCLIVMSKAFLKQRTNACDTLNPFCSRSSWHLRCVSDKFMSVISYTGTYCAQLLWSLQWTLATRHTDRDDMQFKVVFLVALISVNTIWIISIYLAQNWAVSQWLSFRTSNLNAWYLYCKQWRLIDHIILLV